MSDERLVDERVLRRALRLDPDERGPRLDAATLRALAEPPVAPGLAALGAFAFATIALAATVASLRLVADLVSLVPADDALALVAAAAGWLAQALEGILALAAQPAIPIAILAALVVAAFVERRITLEEHRA